MGGDWPRNIRPLDDGALALLGDPVALGIYLAVGESPVSREELGRVTGVPLAQAQRAAEALAHAGLVRYDRGSYVPSARHLREADLDDAAGVPLRMAMLRVAQAAVDQAQRALDGRGAAAKVGIGMASFPDRPDILARAAAIIGEAEDQLRALAEEEPAWRGPRVRAMIFLGSTHAEDSDPPARS